MQQQQRYTGPYRYSREKPNQKERVIHQKNKAKWFAKQLASESLHSKHPNTYQAFKALFRTQKTATKMCDHPKKIISPRNCYQKLQTPENYLNSFGLK